MKKRRFAKKMLAATMAALLAAGMLAGCSSGMIRSINFKFCKSLAVTFMTLAASGAFLLSLYRMEANPSGERME